MSLPPEVSDKSGRLLVEILGKKEHHVSLTRRFGQVLLTESTGKCQASVCTANYHNIIGIFGGNFRNRLGGLWSVVRMIPLEGYISRFRHDGSDGS